MTRTYTAGIRHGSLLTLTLMVLSLDPPVYSQENPASEIVAEEAAITTCVVNLTPIALTTTFDADVGKLYCFTRIKSSTPPAFIKHLWFHGDKMVMEITLPVKSTNWRTYSTKTILPSAVGAWKVDVTSEDGTILKTLDFTIR